MGNRTRIRCIGSIRRASLLWRIPALWEPIFRGSASSRLFDVPASSSRLRGAHQASQVATKI